MYDYEWLILERQESEGDDCTHCPDKTDCHNQCMQIEEHCNPCLFVNKKGKKQ